MRCELSATARLAPDPVEGEAGGEEDGGENPEEAVAMILRPDAPMEDEDVVCRACWVGCAGEPADSAGGDEGVDGAVEVRVHDASVMQPAQGDRAEMQQRGEGPAEKAGDGALL